jgi:hypothetical protein
MAEEIGGKSPSTPAAYRPNPVGWQPLVDGEAAWEQTRLTAMLILGEGRWEAHQSSVVTAMAVGWRGAPMRGSADFRWLCWCGRRAPQTSGDTTGGVDEVGGAPEAAVDDGQ